VKEMLATISDDTATKVDRDRKMFGEGWLRVTSDGRVEHVPVARVQVLPEDNSWRHEWAPVKADEAARRLADAEYRRVWSGK